MTDAADQGLLCKGRPACHLGCLHAHSTGRELRVGELQLAVLGPPGAQGPTKTIPGLPGSALPLPSHPRPQRRLTSPTIAAVKALGWATWRPRCQAVPARDQCDHLKCPRGRPSWKSEKASRLQRTTQEKFNLCLPGSERRAQSGYAG